MLINTQNTYIYIYILYYIDTHHCQSYCANQQKQKFIMHPQSDQHGLDSTPGSIPFLDTVSRNEVRVTGWYNGYCQVATSGNNNRYFFCKWPDRLTIFHGIYTHFILIYIGREWTWEKMALCAIDTSFFQKMSFVPRNPTKTNIYYKSLT